MNEYLVYSRIHSQKKWLHDDEGLGLNKIILSILYEYEMVSSLTDDEKKKFRFGIDSLLKTRYNRKHIKEILIYRLAIILNEKDKHSYGLLSDLSINQLIEIFLEKVGLVKDEFGNWCHVNKLNTNYSALAQLLTDIIKAMLNSENESHRKIASCVYSLIVSNDVRNGLLRLKSNLKDLIVEYIGTTKDSYSKYNQKIKETSDYGNNSENQSSSFLKDNDFDIEYPGGEGDFIDMLFGSDLIVKYKPKNKYFTVQVKTYNVNGDDVIDITDPSFKQWLNEQCSNYSYRDINLLVVVFNGGKIIYCFNLKTTKKYNFKNEVLVEN